MLVLSRVRAHLCAKFSVFYFDRILWLTELFFSGVLCIRFSGLDVDSSNEQQLVTAYDVYATLIDVATHGTFQFDVEPPAMGLHARSLFSTIATDRTCSAAKIADTMCACERA